MPHSANKIVSQPFSCVRNRRLLPLAGLLAIASVIHAQAPGDAAPAPAPAAALVIQSQPAQASATGGKLHGVIKSGNIPLPGVTITATNTLTGKRFVTTTDITGSWSMTIPQNGRYVIRTE